ncbi:Radical SAM superfamily protein [compost metagenome]
MMKLALIALPYGEGPQKIMPLGLQNIAAYLKARSDGVWVRIFDYSEFHGAETDQLGELFEWQPEMVGFSIYSSHVEVAKAWALEVSKRLPGALLFCGGPHISLAAESFLAYSEMLFKVALIGEGEYSTNELVKCFNTYCGSEGGESFSQAEKMKGFCKVGFADIPNAVWKNCAGEYIHTKLFCNQLPPKEWENPLLDYSSTNLQHLKYTDRRDGVTRSAIALTSSRGCPLTCSFCAIVAADKNGPKWRAVSAKTLLRWLREAHEIYDFTHVYMMDANFFVRRERVLEFSEGLHRDFQGRVTWSSSSTVGYLLKIRDCLPVLVEQGLRLVELGIESGSQAQLNYMNKKVTVEQNVEAIRLLQENNLTVGLDFIMFYHDQARQEVIENLLFIHRAGLTDHESFDHYFNIMMLYPGTPVRKNLESRLGEELSLEFLPLSRDFIGNQDVRSIYVRFIDGFAKTYLESLERAISKSIKETKKSESLYGRAYYSLLNVYLRHLPFKVLWSLAHNARSGEGSLMPRGYPELIRLSSGDQFSEDVGDESSIGKVTLGAGGRYGEVILKVC